MMQVFWVKGRINRLTWWIVQIGVFMVGWLVRSMFAPVMPQTKAEAEALLSNPAALQHIGQQFLAVAPIFLITGLLTHWLFVTSSVLRLHDRDNAGWRVVFAYVPYLVIIASFVNILMKGTISVSILGLMMGLVGFLISLVWMIVECGILPGEESPNDYGDPPGAASRRAQLQEELQAMMGGTVGGNDYEPVRSSQGAQGVQGAQGALSAPQPAMSFASSPARSSFGKR
jgi:uncharacterized membrane protein YhaH (DUF805 family)